MPLIEFVALIGFVYIFVLFLIAYFGDSDYSRVNAQDNTNVVYALSLAVYCSSWTFYGAVGTAAVDGLDYLAIYLGPFLVFVFGYPMMRRIIIICKQNNITSISDFIASRYGKSRRIGLLVMVIAVIGSLPYIALQLKAISSSFLVMSSHTSNNNAYLGDNIGFITGVVLAVFTILFGTRHLDATEHHKGMILAISFESIVKLVAILAVGYYAMFLLFNTDSLSNASSDMGLPSIDSVFSGYVFTDTNSTLISFLTKTLLSMSAIFLLPRQFQVTIVEARDHRQFKTAQWVMPVYLILTSVIVIPIALTGSLLLPNSESDLYVLTLPLMAGNETLAMIAFIGGLSAATGMVIVASISLSTMVCNDLVMPYLISIKRLDILNRKNLNHVILLVRRGAIIGLLSGAYGYYILIDSNAQLANIGLVSFAAIVQFLPSVLCALYWRRANSKGVFWGLIAGFVAWSYTLMMPTILKDSGVFNTISSNNWLHPQSLLGMSFDNPLTHGVVWSLGVNIGFLVYFSLREKQSTLEEIQASRFFFSGVKGSNVAQANDLNPYLVHPEALRILSERIIGVRNTDAIFDQYEHQTGINLSEISSVDRRLISLVQTAIAGVIGSTSAQRVISDTLLGDQEYLEEASTLVDEASSVLKFNRNLLQTTLQNITHGISVVDDQLNLVVWNDRYLTLFEYPENMVYVGKPIRELLDFNAKRGDFGDRDHRTEINKRLKFLQTKKPYKVVRERSNGLIVKSTGEPMPGGGFVTTYEDITESVKASELLRVANEELEYRVHQRTKELEILTEELERNTKSKTHFLAAASHDLLQPINAARLFANSVSERANKPQEVERLAESIDRSLVTANHLLRALLDISKLDSGGIVPDVSAFALRPMVHGLIDELEPSAQNKQVILSSNMCELFVQTDKQLLLSVLQNLLTNALRYTSPDGAVTINAEISENDTFVAISVIDTGLGIEKGKLDDIFNEFFQIKTSSSNASNGLGLGLSIVKRISRLLDLRVHVESNYGKGSAFTINVPLAKGELGSMNNGPVEANYVPVDHLRHLKILCVDNDHAVLEAMQTLIEGWGCDVVCVKSYEEGVLLLRSHSFDIVLADYRLDFDETGLDLLNVFKQQSGGANDVIAGVLVTAEQNEELKKEAQKLGFQFLAKPIEPAALKSLLVYFLN